MVVKLIFHGREEKMPKKDPNWVRVRVEKNQMGRLGLSVYPTIIYVSFK